MNRPTKYYLTAAALLVTVMVVGLLQSWGPRTEGSRSKTVERTSAKTKSEALVVNTSDIESNKLSEAQLREYVSFFENPKLPPTQFHTKAEVSLGQSLITQAYEGRPGEFVLTRFTPSMRTQSDSDEAPLQMEFKTSVVDISGNQRDLVKYPLKMFRTSGNHTTSGANVSAPEGVYKISVEASLNKSGDVSVDVTGGYFARGSKSNPKYD